MPAIPIIPKIITFTLKVGAAAAIDFSLDVIDAGCVPTPGAVQTVRTLDGVTHQDAESETWSLDLRAVQDWSTSRPGLASYLYTNKGATATFVLGIYNAAAGAATPHMTGTVTLVPIPYGGAGNTFVEAEVSLPMDGAPTVDITP